MAKTKEIVPQIPEWQSECKYMHLTDLEGFKGVPESVKYVAMDFETTGLDRKSDLPVGLSLCWEPKKAYYVSIRHHNSNNRTEQELVEFLNKHFKEKTIVYWNKKFDHAFMKRLGFTENDTLDAAILSYNVNIHRANKIIGSLKTAAQKVLQTKMLEIWEVLGFSRKPNKNEAPIEFHKQPVNKYILAYACADADLTLRLFNRFVEEGALNPRLDTIRRLDHKFLDGIEYMENCGVKIDNDLLRQYQQDLIQECQQIEQEVEHLIGRPINLGSHKQMSDLLYNELKIPPKHFTPKNAPSAGKHALTHIFRKYRKKYPALGKIKLWRQLQKRLTGYVNPLLNGQDPRDGRVHPTYHTTSQITGRLSSHGDGVYLRRLNIQNIPKDKKDYPYNIRKAMITEPGYTWVSIDWSGIELRIIAHFSQDPNLIEEFKLGDPHARTAKKVFGAKEADEDWPQKRQDGKTINFNLAYTFNISELCYRLNLSELAGWHIYNTLFHLTYPVWGKYKKLLRNEARETRMTNTLWGRIRDLNHEYDKVSVGFGDRSALNHPIQGTCADFLRYAVFRIHRWIKRSNLFNEIKMVNSIHDELNFEVKGKPGEKEFEDYVLKLKELMEYTPAGFSVPVKANITVGRSWGEQSEWKPQKNLDI